MHITDPQFTHWDPVTHLYSPGNLLITWWRHQKEAFSALLAICAENSPVPGEFPAQRPVTRSFDVFLDLRLNKRLSKQSWGWWFETLSRSLWRHRNDWFRWWPVQCQVYASTNAELTPMGQLIHIWMHGISVWCFQIESSRLERILLIAMSSSYFS